MKDVEKKLIGALSKGYRQRVGLADALVHEPDLLILDEPTSGLDPNQIRQVRELIKNLGKQHTILLSTHILPEVEMTCSRVIIIQQRAESKRATRRRICWARSAPRAACDLEAKVGSDNGAEELKKIAGVRDVNANDDGDWQIFSLRVESGADVREEVFRLASERRWTVRELSQRNAPRSKMSSWKSRIPTKRKNRDAMRKFLILLSREVRSYFYSPIAYIVLVFFLLVSGVRFLLPDLVHESAARSRIRSRKRFLTPSFSGSPSFSFSRSSRCGSSRRNLSSARSSRS